jgi:hypothetical protein
MRSAGKKRKNIFLIFFPRELFMKMNFSFFFLNEAAFFFIWATNTRRWPACRLLNMHDSLSLSAGNMREHLQFTKEATNMDGEKIKREKMFHVNLPRTMAPSMAQ